MWDEIAYPFLHIKGFEIEVWEWISTGNFISHFIRDVIMYPFGIKVKL